jgi:hybrid polyketide synthase/nonribosomal peptide synthetase ACE1
VDVIIHTAALVDHLRPYCSLRTTNVLPTKKLVQFAATHNIPIQYISAASVGRIVGHQTLAEVAITEFLPTGDIDGYTASKWASEVVLGHAHRDLKILVMIHRSTTLIGKDILESSIMTNLLHYAHELRAVADTQGLRGFFDIIAVNVVACTIVREALQSIRGINFSKIGGVRRLPVRNLHSLLAMEIKSNVRKVSLGEWVDLARQAGMRKEMVHIFEEFDKYVKSFVFSEVKCSRESA